jgi:uncharacterized membrane protein YczE
VHAAPVLRGGLFPRLAWLVLGLFLCALGIVLFLEARLGLPPWDVLHQGIAKHTPLSFGFGTVANAALIGLFVALLQPLHGVQALADWPLASRIGLLGLGLVAFGVGSAFYIGAALGAGPRDSLMLVGSRRLGLRIGGVRALIEVSVLVAGFLLGGVVGLGTVVFAALIGPSVEASFWLLSRTPLTDETLFTPVPPDLGR